MEFTSLGPFSAEPSQGNYAVPEVASEVPATGPSQASVTIESVYSPEALARASYSSLNCRAISDTAKDFVNLLTESVGEHELASGARNNKRLKKAGEFRLAVERFVGDLLLVRSDAHGWVYRSMATESFREAPVSYRTFRRLTKSLIDLGLIERKLGYRRVLRFEPEGPWLAHSAHATRFRGTADLVSLANSCGITSEKITEHFAEGLPAHPLILKASSKRPSYGVKVRGKRIRFKPSSRTMELERELIQINQFLDGFDIRGGNHRGYVRIFNKGDDPHFNWDKGGRLYSLGSTNYQRMTKEQRASITIDGNSVVELDIRASYPTILFSVCGRSAELPSDPYNVPGLPRSVVKRWMLATLGSDGHIKRWPPQLINDHFEETGENLKRYRLSALRKLITQHLPLLVGWGELSVDWADLMFLESEAIIKAMLDLMSKGTPSLTVHDSLIVPFESAELGKTILIDQYRRVCGAIPQITIKGSLGNE